MPHPKVEVGYPVVHLGEHKWTDTKPGGNKYVHICLVPLSMGNFRVKESQTFLRRTGTQVMSSPNLSTMSLKLASLGLAPPTSGEPMGRGAHILFLG